MDPREYLKSLVSEPDRLITEIKKPTGICIVYGLRTDDFARFLAKVFTDSYSVDALYKIPFRDGVGAFELKMCPVLLYDTDVRRNLDEMSDYDMSDRKLWAFTRLTPDAGPHPVFEVLPHQTPEFTPAFIEDARAFLALENTASQIKEIPNLGYTTPNDFLAELVLSETEYKRLLEVIKEPAGIVIIRGGRYSGKSTFFRLLHELVGECVDVNRLSELTPTDEVAFIDTNGHHTIKEINELLYINPNTQSSIRKVWIAADVWISKLKKASFAEIGITVIYFPNRFYTWRQGPFTRDFIEDLAELDVD
jgi:hypothetical protein